MRFNIDKESTSEQSSTPATSSIPVIDPIDISNFIDNLDTTVAEIERLQKEMQEKVSLQFSFAIQELFRLVPKVQAICWTQYSPYFNDGDECVFHVRNVSVLSFIPDYTSYEYEVDENTDFAISEYQTTKLLTELELKACESVNNLISSNEDLMQRLYGNHVSIVVTKENTKVEDYDHE